MCPGFDRNCVPGALPRRVSSGLVVGFQTIVWAEIAPGLGPSVILSPDSQSSSWTEPALPLLPLEHLLAPSFATPSPLDFWDLRGTEHAQSKTGVLSLLSACCVRGICELFMLCCRLNTLTGNSLGLFPCRPECQKELDAANSVRLCG